ncbi:MAG: MmgE/PrpD family protein [Rhodospirillales bacterium]
MDGHASERPDNIYTKGIAQFVANLKYEDIPAEARHRVKLLILDSLGCGLYSYDLAWSRILRETLTDIDDTRRATVWGTKQKLSGVHAALCNGTQIQGFEIDDVHRQGALHVGAVVLPPLVAIAEMNKGMSGKEFMTSAVAGYEIGPRVGMCMGKQHLEQGWHTGGTIGVFSAAAGAIRALGLTAEQAVHAIGMAGTQASALMAAQFGAMVKRMHAGKSAQSGFYAALLAKRGFTGIIDVFEAEYGGYCTTLSRSTDLFDRTELTKGLGKNWELMRILLKFYSCVASNHTTLNAIENMQKKKPFGADDVEKIVVYGSKSTVEHVGWEYRPEGVTAAQLNLGFCIGTLLIEGECFVDQFSEAIIADPKRMAFAKKVECVEDAAITDLGADMRHKVRVVLTLKDGTEMEDTVEKARGSEVNFAPDEQIVGKFKKLAVKALPQKQVDALADAVMDMENLKDAGEIAKLLTPA